MISHISSEENDRVLLPCATSRCLDQSQLISGNTDATNTNNNKRGRDTPYLPTRKLGPQLLRSLRWQAQSLVFRPENPNSLELNCCSDTIEGTCKHLQTTNANHWVGKRDFPTNLPVLVEFHQLLRPNSISTHHSRDLPQMGERLATEDKMVKRIAWMTIPLVPSLVPALVHKPRESTKLRRRRLNFFASGKLRDYMSHHEDRHCSQILNLRSILALAP